MLEVKNLNYVRGSRSGVRYSVTLEGVEYQSLSKASIAYGFNYNKIKRRLQRGWSVEEAFELTTRMPTENKRLKKEEWETALKTGKRTCRDCGETKELDKFPIHNTCVGGYSPVCRACKTNQTREKRYGITAEQYKSMLAEQGGKCKICGTKTPRTRRSKVYEVGWAFCVDHCHKTGKVRGLLCMPCNVGLGKFNDNIDNLKSAIDYLTES